LPSEKSDRTASGKWAKDLRRPSRSSKPLI